MFSTRIPTNLEPNQLTQALAELRARRQPILDLTETNPTRAGLEYPPDLLAPLADPRSLAYEPDPFGLRSAREAVAGSGLPPGVQVHPAHIVLTASTSEAYSFLFKLLCEPGDEVLVPAPSYPLFDQLTRLDGVGVRSYPLEYHGVWSADTAELERSITARTRAVLVVSPNNPTGSVLGRAELEALCKICGRHGLALVGDEVFADYPLEPRPDRTTVLAQAEVLAFALGGLSKSVGLPQLKLAWIAAAGPRALLEAALARLELIGDAYLSVGTPVQQAAGPLLAAGARVRRLIQDRLVANLETLRAAAAHTPCSVLRVEGGWSAVVRVPATRSEEQLVLELLEHDGVLAHPGYFFDFPREAYVIVSLLPRPSVFADGIGRLLARAGASPAPV
ncbi:MAG: pyridoxal phosphate-dependent aminotransferase [Acidobacteria bacterium]|nr:MAG: pyridoxal phosphate-dependent aminotransferase [Acidobacteriota bacterium]